MTLVDLLVTILFIGLGAVVGAASGSWIGIWCGGFIGLGLLWLLCTRNSRRVGRDLIEVGNRKSWDDYKKYRFDSSWEGDGQIIDGEERPLWRYKSVGGNIFRSTSYGFFWLPPFVVEDLEGRELLAFTRTKRFPFSVFEVKEGDHVVGTIRQQSLLFTKYLLEFESGLRCVFYLPPFTVLFHGIADTGERILVQRWHHQVWLVGIDSSIDSFPLVAAIVFIHRERLRHG